MPDFSSALQPHFEGRLESGETLEGVCAATQQSAFKGRSVAVGVTDRRLLLVPLDRRGRPTDEFIPIRPEDITGAKAQGAGGGWASVGPALLDSTAVTIQLKTAQGEKHKLSLMRGTGMVARLGGGEGQREGVEALGRWFERFAREE